MTISPERLRKLIAALDAYCVSAYADNTLRESAIALRELEQARTTLEGVRAGTHVIVPIVPSDAAVLAGNRKVYEYDTRLGDTDNIDARDTCAYEVYRAMLAPEKEPAQEKTFKPNAWHKPSEKDL